MLRLVFKSLRADFDVRVTLVARKPAIEELIEQELAIEEEGGRDVHSSLTRRYLNSLALMLESIRSTNNTRFSNPRNPRRDCGRLDTMFRNLLDSLFDLVSAYYWMTARVLPVLLQIAISHDPGVVGDGKRSKKLRKKSALKWFFEFSNRVDSGCAGAILPKVE